MSGPTNPPPFNSVPYPAYEYAEVVRAAKITSITPGDTSSVLALDGFDSITVSSELMSRTNPAVGDYLIVSVDGKEFIASQQEFEKDFKLATIVQTAETAGDTVVAVVENDVAEVKADIEVKHAELQAASASLLDKIRSYFAEIPAHFHEEMAAIEAKL